MGGHQNDFDGMPGRDHWLYNRLPRKEIPEGEPPFQTRILCPDPSTQFVD